MLKFTRDFLERAIHGPSKLPLKKGGSNLKYRKTPWVERFKFSYLGATAKAVKASLTRTKRQPTNSLVDKKISERRQRLRDKYGWKSVKKPRWLGKSYVDTREVNYDKPKAAKNTDDSADKKKRTVHFGSKPVTKTRTFNRWDHEAFPWWQEHLVLEEVEGGMEEEEEEEDFF